MSLLMEVIEWIDPTGDEMIYRVPQEGSADFKLGAQLIVRDSQMAIFFRSAAMPPIPLLPVGIRSRL